MFDKIYSAIFGKTEYPSVEETCAKKAQEQEQHFKVLVEAFPELAPGLAKKVDGILKSSDFAGNSEPVQVGEVTPGNVAHVWGAMAAGACLKHPDRAR